VSFLGKEQLLHHPFISIAIVIAMISPGVISILKSSDFFIGIVFPAKT